jgi:hypothetical protein
LGTERASTEARPLSGEVSPGAESVSVAPKQSPTTQTRSARVTEPRRHRASPQTHLGEHANSLTPPPSLAVIDRRLRRTWASASSAPLFFGVMAPKKAGKGAKKAAPAHRSKRKVARRSGHPAAPLTLPQARRLTSRRRSSQSDSLWNDAVAGQTVHAQYTECTLCIETVALCMTGTRSCAKLVNRVVNRVRRVIGGWLLIGCTFERPVSAC